MGDEEEEGPKYGLWDGEKNEANEPVGFGKATYTNADCYEGEMVEGQRSGKGKYTWQAGAIIPGDADPPKKQPGGQFEGMYLDHKKAGEGTASYIQKQRREELHSKYIGSFVAGLKSGRGSYQYPNGDWYKGEWFQGKKHGQGTYFVKQGDCHFIGEWSEGSFVAGDWKLKDGSFYRGRFVDGRPAAGPAVYTFRNGTVQYGEWIAKKRELAEGEEEEVPEGEAPKPKFTMIWRSTTVTSFAQRPKERPCRMLTLFFVLCNLRGVLFCALPVPESSSYINLGLDCLPHSRGSQERAGRGTEQRSLCCCVRLGYPWSSRELELVFRLDHVPMWLGSLAGRSLDARMPGCASGLIRYDQQGQPWRYDPACFLTECRTGGGRQVTPISASGGQVWVTGRSGHRTGGVCEGPGPNSKMGRQCGT